MVEVTADVVDETIKVQQKPVDKSSSTWLAEGRRDFICNDFEKAANCFSQACEKMTSEFGDRALETAEAYYWYGKALLEMSRMQSDFLGAKAEQEDVEKETKEEETTVDDETTKEETTLETENGTTKETDEEETTQEEQTPEETTNEETTTQDEEDSTIDRASIEVNADTITETEGLTEDVSEDAAEEDDEEDEESPADGQLAYEMLELARTIYEGHADSDKQTESRRAECHMSLGELSAENGIFETAIDEYHVALDVLTRLYPDEHRRIAEVYFQLGCSQDAIYDFKKSCMSFEKAIELMDKRVAELKSTENTDAFTRADKKELLSLETSVIPELKNRLTDAKVSQEKHLSEKEMLKQALLMKATTSSFDSAPTTSSEPKTNINHLVKRKRKSDEIDRNGDEEPLAKK